MYLKFVKGIRWNDIPVFQIVKKSLYGGDFSFNCFGFIRLMKMCDIILQNKRCDLLDIRDRYGLDKLLQVDSICLKSLAVKSLLIQAKL